jgi:hypothetical protein
MDFIINYWGQFIFGIIGTWIVSTVKKNKAENHALRLGMRAILRDRIIQTYNHYSEKGYCPIYARENVSNMYDAYHNLGGNGTVTTLYERLQDLPTEGGEYGEY